MSPHPSDQKSLESLCSVVKTLIVCGVRAIKGQKSFELFWTAKKITNSWPYEGGGAIASEIWMPPVSLVSPKRLHLKSVFLKKMENVFILKWLRLKRWQNLNELQRCHSVRRVPQTGNSHIFSNIKNCFLTILSMFHHICPQTTLVFLSFPPVPHVFDLTLV